MTDVATIFNQYYRKLVYFLNTIIDNQQEAEDIAMDVIYRCKDREGDLKSLLFVSARNAAKDYLRATYRHDMSYKELGYLNPDIDFMALEIQTDYLASLLKALESLPPKTRKVFMLFWKGQDTEQIAASLHIKTRTVINLKAYAIKVLRDSLNGRKKWQQSPQIKRPPSHA